MSADTAPRAERRRQAVAWALYALLFAVGGFTVWYRGTYNVFLAKVPTRECTGATGTTTTTPRR
jgi:hypothetical protein